MEFLIIIVSLLLIISIVFFILGGRRLTTAKAQTIENGFLKQEQERLLTQAAQIKQNIMALQQEHEAWIEKMDNQLAVEKDKIQQQLDIFKQNTQYAMQNYISSMEDSYNSADADFDKKIEKKNQEYSKVSEELENIRATLSAATEARIREEEKKGNLDFYKLQVTDLELDDIKKLNSIKPMLHNPVILSKLIWSTYFQKPYKALCSRILGENVVCGIYKITDLTTEQYYIGQSVDCGKRWADHIKAGLGIDNNGTNKLYKAMQAHGVENFTFELLESCERKLLDEKEKFFINLYQSDKFGLNVTKGNG